MSFNQKFEPKDGKVLHGAGQSSEQFKKYWNLVNKNKPLIYMIYNRINDIQEKFPKKINELNSINKKLWLQLGLNLQPKEEKEKCNEIILGEYDAELNFLIKVLKNFKNPVFLRIGYEFNEPKKYEPLKFIEAWKYIVNLFRKNKVKNVAFIWDACTAFNKEINEIMEYYPGDEYVDWFGNNLFGVRHFKDNKDKITEEFYKKSIEHKKPLMIGESTPAKVGVDKGQESWNEWFKPYFQWIKEHPNCKAFCYINWDWGKDWKQPEWLNGRIEENEIVRKNFVKELKNPRYLHLKNK